MATTQSEDKSWDLLIVGGGAAGFFTAINSAELHPELSIAILEKGKQGLQKVKISGGGRCNVTLPPRKLKRRNHATAQNRQCQI